MSHENIIHAFYFRIAYVVVRTTATGTNTSTTPPTRTDPVSHIPTITSSNKLIKSKQSKDEGVKRASVRRATLGRSKLSRSPAKPFTVTPTNQTVTTTTANLQSSPLHERVQVEEMIGPVTRSRMCRFCTSPDDSASELNYKRGKRSLSSSRFHEKKNKLSRKTQVLVPSSITGTTITRRLRKETSLDSALADVATHEAHENSSLSEAPPPKEAAKTRAKKPTVRSASQKVLSTN
jgi:hypothetical protein